MQIFVKIPDGKNIIIPVVLAKTTIADVKKRVMEKSGIPLDDMILIYNNVLLKNEKTLQFYGIQQEAQLEADKVDLLVDKFKQQLNCLQVEQSQYQQKLSQEISEKEQLKVNYKLLQEQLNKQIEIRQQLEKDLSQAKIHSEADLRSTQQYIQKGEQQYISQIQKLQSQCQKLEIENSTLKVLTDRLESEVRGKTNQLEILQLEKQQLPNKTEDLQKMKNELMEKKFQIQDLEKKLDFANIREGQVKDQISRELRNNKQANKQLVMQIEELNEKNKKLQIELVKQEIISKQDQQTKQQLWDAQSKNIDLQKDISEQRQLIIQLQEEVKGCENAKKAVMKCIANRNDYPAIDKIQMYETRISKLNAELRSALQSLEESKQQLQCVKRAECENQNRISELERSANIQAHILTEKDKKIKELEYERTKFHYSDDYQQ